MNVSHRNTRIALAVLAMAASAGAQAALTLAPGGGLCQTWLPTGDPAILAAGTCSATNVDAALTGAGNVELGKFGSSPVTMLTGTLGGHNVVLSSLLFSDWTADGGTLADRYITAAFASVGQTLNNVQRTALVGLMLDLPHGGANGAYKVLSDPNVSYAGASNGAIYVGLDGLYDATSYLNNLLSVANAAIPGTADDLQPVSFAQASEVVKMQVDGGSVQYLYGFNAAPTGYAAGDGQSYSGVYQVPEPKSLALLGLGLVGLFVGRRRDARDA